MMPYAEAFQIGLDSVLAHKLRSVLTMLGVVFGVAAVISMLSIGEGARRSAIEQIKLLGTNNIRIRQLKLTGAQAELAEKSSSDGLTYGDALVIASNLPNIQGVSPLRFIDGEITRGSKESTGRVIGADDRYDEVTNFRPAEGRFITQLDVKEAKRVCVIGSEVRKELFGHGDPINRRLMVDDTWFTVVGLMETKPIKEGKTS